MSESSRTAIPTLEDVAAEVGVSTATVSRCLNSPEKVSKKTLGRVMAAVDALGYTPNFGAQALAARKTRTVGAIIPTMDNAIFARALQSMQEKLRQHNIALLVASSQYEEEIEASQIRTLVSRGAEAIFLIGLSRSGEIMTFLHNRQVHVVAGWVAHEQEGVVSIGFDNHRAMVSMADKIFELGHRHIAYISGMTKGNDRAAMRVEGLLQAATEQGIAVDSIPVIETPYSVENGRLHAKSLLEQHPHLTCLVCGNDVLAAGALIAAREMGRQVPDDLSITGFDDIDLSETCYPQLTTVHVPHRHMGEAAADAMIQLLDGGEKPKSQTLQTRLALRGTLAQAREGVGDIAC